MDERTAQQAGAELSAMDSDGDGVGAAVGNFSLSAEALSIPGDLRPADNAASVSTSVRQ